MPHRFKGKCCTTVHDELQRRSSSESFEDLLILHNNGRWSKIRSYLKENGLLIKTKKYANSRQRICKGCIQIIESDEGQNVINFKRQRVEVEPHFSTSQVKEEASVIEDDQTSDMSRSDCINFIERATNEEKIEIARALASRAEFTFPS